GDERRLASDRIETVSRADGRAGLPRLWAHLRTSIVIKCLVLLFWCCAIIISSQDIYFSPNLYMTDCKQNGN
ncbi:unnamed protein product, partial [Musa textilis]